MSDADDIESIREQKIEQLKRSLTAPDEPVHVEDADHFEELTSDGVVLVDFYADWCGPCQMLEPVIEDIAAETDATVAKVDVDEHQSLAGQFGVQGVPTLFLYVDGERAERMVGAQDADRLRSLVESYV